MEWKPACDLPSKNAGTRAMKNRAKGPSPMQYTTKELRSFGLGSNTAPETCNLKIDFCCRRAKRGDNSLL